MVETSPSCARSKIKLQIGLNQLKTAVLMKMGILCNQLSTCKTVTKHVRSLTCTVTTIVSIRCHRDSPRGAEVEIVVTQKKYEYHIEMGAKGIPLQWNFRHPNPWYVTGWCWGQIYNECMLHIKSDVLQGDSQNSLKWNAYHRQWLLLYDSPRPV